MKPTIEAAPSRPPFLLLLALLLPLAGCRDGLGAELRGAWVEILYRGSSYNEETIAVGDVLQLTGRVVDATGKELPRERVSWSTGNDAVAGVDGAGAVVARGFGSTYVVASHKVGTDTAWVTVAAGVTAPLGCSESQVVPIAVGEARSYSGAEAVSICLPGGQATNAEYVLITTNAASSAGSVLPVRLSATGVTFVFNPPNPALSPAHEPRAPVQDTRFHQQMRETISAGLEPLLRSEGAVPMPPARQVSAGELMSLNTARGTNGCDAVERRTGRVRRVTQRAILVADTLNPSGGFDDADYDEFGAFFDEEVWPLVTGTFGTPSDIDGNGRVIIFFTVAVNELAENANNSNSGTYVGGFFFNRDLFTQRSCGGSNVAEMFYLLVPDSAGQSMPGGRRPFPRTMVRAQIPALLVHEFQHLVNDSRRLHVNSAPIWEQTWLNEGLSHIAEELMFYRRAGLEPRQNIGASALVGVQARNAFRSFQLDNVDRLAQFLAEPETASPLGPDLLVTRAAAWSFLRYAADRNPGGEAALWDALVRSSRTAGLENLAQAIGDDPLVWIRDWTAALYLADTGFDVDERHRIRSWNFRQIFPNLSLLGVGRSNRPYPIRAPRLFADQPRNVQLHGSTAAYARFGVEPGGRGAVRVTVGGAGQLPPPSRLTVLVVRTR